MAMESKVVIVPDGYKIKSTGVFDLPDLYLEIYRWFRHFTYAWKETKYRNIDQPDGGKQIEIMWFCERKVDDYVTFVITLHLQAFVKDTEGMKGGVKTKMQGGSVEFRAGAYMKKKVEIWESKPMGDLLGRIYEKILIKERLDNYEEEIYIDTHKLFDEIKAYLQMHR
ncbi:hypothetical protein HY643_02585 [Candidatus Woesearchaeota archaeon]|nr:hypothetical protein [Candidatus Woesearchaeota archaeon]